MDIIMMARDLGAAIQGCDEYVAHKVARDAADADTKLQEKIGEFNLKKMTLSQEAQKGEGKDAAKLNELNTCVKELYGEIMAVPSMMAYNTTKGEMDKLLNFIQQIVVYAANGEDPYTVTEESEDGGCSGSCSSCSGCH
ncbi:MAG: YlbF family regulator [Angelakisella sp.]